MHTGSSSRFCCWSPCRFYPTRRKSSCQEVEVEVVLDFSNNKRESLWISHQAGSMICQLAMNSSWLKAEFNLQIDGAIILLRWLFQSIREGTGFKADSKAGPKCTLRSGTSKEEVSWEKIQVSNASSCVLLGNDCLASSCAIIGIV